MKRGNLCLLKIEIRIAVSKLKLQSCKSGIVKTVKS